MELTGEDLAFLQYTGGTTGVSKGAMLTHRNMVSSVLQADGFLRPFAHEGEEVIITALPLYHIFALAVNCLTYMRFGAMSVLITNPRDMPGFVRILKGVRFTAITGVNTLFNGLMNTKGFAALDFSPLRISVGGGMAVQSAVAERWKKMTGIPLLEGYGLTETSPCACMNPLHLEDYTGAVGVPMSSTECRVVDDGGCALPVDTPGELCVRGPQVMRGYWNRPDDTAAAIDEEGWLRTGDIAEMDASGFFRIVDRKKDMILVSGFNVYPNEVEEVLSQHPEVLEVGAIGRGGRAQRRGGQDRRGEAFAGTDRRVVAGVLPGASHRLQTPAAHRVRERAPEDQRGEDPAPGAARAVRFAGPWRRIVAAIGPIPASRPRPCRSRPADRPSWIRPSRPKTQQTWAPVSGLRSSPTLTGSSIRGSRRSSSGAESWCTPATSGAWRCSTPSRGRTGQQRHRFEMGPKRAPAT